MIIVESWTKNLTNLQKQYPDAVIIDVTEQAPDEFVRFSPFYPHGGIPVPFSFGWMSQTVEGIWQGLKIFAHHGIDTGKFNISDRKSLRRTTRRYGPVTGYRKGVRGAEILDYLSARKLIFASAYLWVMEHRLTGLLSKLRDLSENKTVILLDHETNCDIEDLSSPLSHAYLIKSYIEGNYPIPLTLPPSPEEKEVYEVGTPVYHPMFGPAVVLEDLGERVRVDFEGEEVLLQKRYAKLLRIYENYPDGDYPDDE